MPDVEKIIQLLDRAADYARRTGRDYLREDRLVRRFRIGGNIFAAELRGYRSTYHVVVRFRPGNDGLECSCDRIKQPCAHAAALLLDLQSKSDQYFELGWRAVVAAERARLAMPVVAEIDWNLIPDVAPWWRTVEPWQAVERLLPLMDRATRRGQPLARNRLTEIWAELNPEAILLPQTQALFADWIKPYQTSARPEDGADWVALRWMQPALGWTVSLSPPEVAAAQIAALLHRLTDPAPLLQTTPARRAALMHDLTVLDARLGHQLWTVLRTPVLDHADALFAAGQRDWAAAWLESELPEHPALRRQARARLVDWLADEASVPHRLALAWDTGNLEWLTPVRQYLNPQEWESIMTALKTPSSEA